MSLARNRADRLNISRRADGVTENTVGGGRITVVRVSFDERVIDQCCRPLERHWWRVAAIERATVDRSQQISGLGTTNLRFVDKDRDRAVCVKVTAGNESIIMSDRILGGNAQDKSNYLRSYGAVLKTDIAILVGGHSDKKLLVRVWICRCANPVPNQTPAAVRRKSEQISDLHLKH